MSTRTDTERELRSAASQVALLAGLEAHSRQHDRIRAQVIGGLIPLADRLARRYAHRGESTEDLEQVARIGLIKAVDGFDPRLGGFLGYAIPTIRGELKRHFRDGCWDIRIPRRLQELRIEVRSATERISQQSGHEPSVDEIAVALSVGPADVRAALQAANAFRVGSLNVDAAADGEISTQLVDAIGGTDERLDGVPDEVSLRPALDRLPERERQVLAMRFFQGMTQSQIAERIGLSQMHVSRLLQRTLIGLRDWMNGDATEVSVCRPRRRPQGRRLRHRQRRGRRLAA